MSDDAFSAENARALWDEAADGWDEFVGRGIDIYRTELHGPALLAHCGDVAGKRTLDLGCGQGWFSRLLAERGALVHGIDWSARLIAHAERREESREDGLAGSANRVTYSVLDAAHIDERFAVSAFDLITGCMSLMDMPDPGRVLTAARRLLAPGGRVVFSVPNPVTDSAHRMWKSDEHGKRYALEVGGYFEGKSRVMYWEKHVPRPFRTVQYRLTLEQWSRAFEAAGLLVRSMREAYPSAEALARHPALADATLVPYFLSFELVAAPPR